MTPTVPDGPDTELAAAIGFLARNEGLLIEMEHSPAGRAAAAIVRAVLARPAAGRDLTAQDVGVALDGVTHLSRQIRDEVARELNGIARPAVARTDGQPPAEGLDPLAHVQPGHAADDILCGDQHGPWNCTRDLQHPGQHIASIGHGQRVGAVWPAAPADDIAVPDLRDVGPLRRDLAEDVARDGAGADHLPPREVLRRLDALPVLADEPVAPVLSDYAQRNAEALGRAIDQAEEETRVARAERDELRVQLEEARSLAEEARSAAPADDTAAPDRVELLGRACRYAEGVVFGDHPEDAPGTVRDGLADGWMAGYLAAAQPVRGSQPEATDG